MAAIHFESEVIKAGPLDIIRLPKSVSALLPSRGMTMVQGTCNGHVFTAALEPDGSGSHWLNVDDELRKAVDVQVGDHIELSIGPTKDWPEPTIPDDLRVALAGDHTAQQLWAKITPMARWDWIRWVRSTSQPETRKRRVEVAMSKMNAGTRRPCCFNRTDCTEPAVTKNGKLVTQLTKA